MGLTGNAANNGMVMRAARRILEVARQHMVKEAVGSGESDGAPASGGGVVRLAGRIQVHHIHEGDITSLRQLFAKWQQQPCYSFAVVSSAAVRVGAETGGSDEALERLKGMLQDVPAMVGLCVCWSPREVVHIEVPLNVSSSSSSYAVALREGLQGIFADCNKNGICWDCSTALASLEGPCGFTMGGHLDDPLAALRVLHPDIELRCDGEALSGLALLKVARASILPDYHMRILGQYDGAVAVALQQASLSWVMAPVLQGMLASKQLLGVYQGLAMSAVRAVGDTHRNWVKVDLQALRYAVSAHTHTLQMLAACVKRETGFVLGGQDDVYAILASFSLHSADTLCNMPPEQAVLRVMGSALQRARAGNVLALRFMLCYCRLWQAREEARLLLGAVASGEEGGGYGRLWLRSQHDIMSGSPGISATCVSVQGCAIPCNPVEVCMVSLQHYDTAALVAAVASSPVLVCAPSGQLGYVVEVKQQPVPWHSGDAWQGHGGAEGTCALGLVCWVDAVTREVRESRHALAVLHEVRAAGSSSSGSVVSSRDGMAGSSESCLPAAAAACTSLAGNVDWDVQLTTCFWSLRRSLSPSDKSRLFVGVDFSQLALLTFALGSGDEGLLACCSAEDPLGESAAKWAAAFSASAIAAVVSAAGKGALEGVQIADEKGQLKAVFREVLASIMAGHKPRQLAQLLEVTTAVASALQEGVVQAFPGVEALLLRITTSCLRSG